MDVEAHKKSDTYSLSSSSSDTNHAMEPTQGVTLGGAGTGRNSSGHDEIQAIPRFPVEFRTLSLHVETRPSVQGDQHDKSRKATTKGKQLR